MSNQKQPFYDKHLPAHRRAVRKDQELAKNSVINLRKAAAAGNLKTFTTILRKEFPKGEYLFYGQRDQSYLTEIFNQGDKKGNTALMLAVKNGHYEIVKALCDDNQKRDYNYKRLRIDQENNDKVTPLQAAVRNGDLRLVQCLLANGAEVKQSIINEAKNDSYIAKLIAAKVSLSKLLYLIASGNVEGIKSHLLKNPEMDINATCKDSFFTRNTTALHVAVAYQQPQAMEILFNRGVNPTVKDEDGKTAAQILKDNITWRQKKIDRYFEMIGKGDRFELQTLKYHRDIYKHLKEYEVTYKRKEYIRNEQEREEQRRSHRDEPSLSFFVFFKKILPKHFQDLSVTSILKLV